MDSRAVAALEAGFGWSEGVPRFACRWIVKGETPDYAFRSTIFDLLPDRRQFVVYPAAVGTFAIRLDRAAVEMLAATLETGDACAVAGVHPVHGRRLLGLRPYSAPHEPCWTNRPVDAPRYLGPVELYVDLPGQGIRVVYRRERLFALAETFAEIVRSLR